MSVDVVAREVRRMADLAWAAGVIEVRGLFAVIERHRANARVEFEPRLRVIGRESDLALLSRLRETLGGTIAHPRGFQRQEWRLTGARAVRDAGTALLAHMTVPDATMAPVRARDLKTLVRFCAHVAAYKRTSFEERAIPEEELDLRRMLAGGLLRVYEHRPRLPISFMLSPDPDDPSDIPF
jgi:hypothetical protein